MRWLTNNGAAQPVWTKIAWGVDREQIGQSRTRAVSPALDGAGGAAALCRGLVVGERRSAYQKQSLSLLRREL